MCGQGVSSVSKLGVEVIGRIYYGNRDEKYYFFFRKCSGRYDTFGGIKYSGMESSAGQFLQHTPQHAALCSV